MVKSPQGTIAIYKIRLTRHCDIHAASIIAKKVVDQGQKLHR